MSDDVASDGGGLTVGRNEDRQRRCGCKVWCTNLPESEDHPQAVCKGLRIKPYWLDEGDQLEELDAKS